MIDLHIDGHALDVPGNPADPLIDRNGDTALAQILGPERNGRQPHAGKQGAIETLQHHPVPTLAGGAIQATWA